MAANIARSEGAKLSCLILHDAFPDHLQNVTSAFEKTMKEEVIEKLSAHGLSDVPITFDDATPGFVTIIQHVLKNKYDLVIKDAENIERKGEKGFKSMDMSLLRKCPSPVWLCRDFKNIDAPKVLTAIDAKADTPEGRELSLTLLRMGAHLSSALGGSNTVISCWDFEHEGFLRNAPFASVSGVEADEIVKKEEEEYKTALHTLLADSQIAECETVCNRGQPATLIPSYAKDNDFDIVLMGTVARTGIPGFIIGNTAENILQNLESGLLAIKPNGFISPVKG